MKQNKTRYITQVSALSAIAAVLMLFEFPLWFAPGFYKMDLSDLPALIGGFAFGPLASVLIELFKNVLNIIINGTTTAFIGEASNFVIGCSFVLPATIIYKYNRNKKYAVYGMLAGTASLAIIGSAMNAFVLIPTYVKMLGLPLENIIAMGNAVNSNITGMWSLILYAVVPFNALKGIGVSAITTVIYKRIRVILK